MPEYALSSQDSLRSLVVIVRSHIPRPEPDFDEDSDLTDGGLDSLGAVKLALDVEEKFGVLLADEYLVRETFCSCRSLWAALQASAVESAVSAPEDPGA
ncbi:MAG TPA: phosphopantetheine-binding protein [Dehalococcoidia bacterium]|jgi:acyl carrier protein|nr:phosphopantetheine-binding protein [Dehalococcoidia bacterium]